MPKMLMDSSKTPKGLLDAIYGVSQRVNRKFEDVGRQIEESVEEDDSTVERNFKKAAGKGVGLLPWVNPVPENDLGLALSVLPVGAIASAAIKPLTAPVKKVLSSLRAQEAPVPLQKILNLLKKEGLKKTELEDSGVLEFPTTKGNVKPREMLEKIDEVAPNVKPQHSEEWATYTIEREKRTQPKNYKHTEYYSTKSPVIAPIISDYSKGHLNFSNAVDNYPLFHSRSSQMVDEAGKPVRVVQETQSDLHQAAAKLGYGKTPDVTKQAELAGKLREAIRSRDAYPAEPVLDTIEDVFYSPYANLTRRRPVVSREGPRGLYDNEAVEEAQAIIDDLRTFKKKREEAYQHVVGKPVQFSYDSLLAPAMLRGRSPGLAQRTGLNHPEIREVIDTMGGKDILDAFDRLQKLSPKELQHLDRRAKKTTARAEQYARTQRRTLDDAWKRTYDDSLIELLGPEFPELQEAAARRVRTRTELSPLLDELEKKSSRYENVIRKTPSRFSYFLANRGEIPDNYRPIYDDDGTRTPLQRAIRDRWAALVDRQGELSEEIYDASSRWTETLDDVKDRVLYAESPRLRDKVPDIPFKQSWARQALKDELRRAVEAGDAKFAIATPDDLSKAVQPRAHFQSLTYDAQAQTLRAITKDGREIVERIPPEKLASYTGPDVATELLQTGTSRGENVIKPGFRKFYEQDLPNEFEDILRRHGIEPERTDEVLGHLDIPPSYIGSDRELMRDTVGRLLGTVPNNPAFRPLTRPTPTYNITNPAILDMVKQGFPLGALATGILGLGAYENQKAQGNAILGL